MIALKMERVPVTLCRFHGGNWSLIGRGRLGEASGMDPSFLAGAPGTDGDC